MAFSELFSEHRGGEIAGVLLFAATLLVAVSLVSFHPDDPAWFFATGGEHLVVQNVVGRFGAFLSIVLYETLGLAAFLLPVFFAVAGWFCFWGREMTPFWPRVGAAAVFLLAVAALGHVVVDGVSLFGKTVAAGGLVGAAAGKFLVSYLNVFGAILLLVTTALVAFSFVTLVSYARLAAGAAAFAKALTTRIRVWAVFHRDVKRRAKERGAVLEKHLKRAEEAKKTERPIPVVNAAATESKGTLFEPEAAEPPARKGKCGLPATTLLDAPDAETTLRHEDLVECGKALAAKFREFGIEGEVTEIHPGPVVTMYEFKPAQGVKYSRILTLADDLCLALRADSILINRVPGKPTVGIEVPNERREPIALRELLEDDSFKKSSARLPLALGKQIHGEPYVADLADMPHLLIAGTTGAGKSVSVHAILLSLLYRLTPDELKLILIDPKRVELGLYEGVPHLYAPVIMDPKQAAGVLKWVVKEMEGRYKLLASSGVRTRNIDQFNLHLKNFGKDLRDADGEPLKPLPYIVVVIDEFADLMMTVPREVEDAVARIAQMARAVGIHLLIATQRPSVDVITGVIKANFPSRIAFRVSSKVDSRTILDANGAELLLGRGDMLFLPPGTAQLKRLHGGLVSEREIQKVIHFLKEQGAPSYHQHLLNPARIAEDTENGAGAIADAEDDLYDDAVNLVLSTGVASVSNLQRRFGIGYNRAARLIDMMEMNGVVGPTRGAKPRKILMGNPASAE